MFECAFEKMIPVVDNEKTKLFPSALFVGFEYRPFYDIPTRKRKHESDY